MPKVRSAGALAGHKARTSAAQHRSAPKGGAKQDLRTIGGGDCWCGQRYGHSWPGKAKGKGHPR